MADKQREYTPQPPQRQGEQQEPARRQGEQQDPTRRQVEQHDPTRRQGEQDPMRRQGEQQPPQRRPGGPAQQAEGDRSDKESGQPVQLGRERGAPGREEGSKAK